jgi:BirA family biotin operon repressor/biotin-[acetyl-CoA-carboxylase] ligase
MSPDLLPDEVYARLTTAWIARPYFYEHEVDSTNARLHALAKKGESHGTVYAADTQTQGRGRLSRSWHSPAGLNLYFSVLLRPAWHAPTIPPLSLAAGVALAEAIEPYCNVAPKLKWPNDVLCEGRKVAGILVEAALDGEIVHHVVLGVGLNVNQQEFPGLLAGRAGSLRALTGTQHHRADVLAAVLARLEYWIDVFHENGRAAVIEGWQRRACWMGEKVRVKNGKCELVGTAIGLDPDGALRIEDEDGREHAVLAGDASLAIDREES